MAAKYGLVALAWVAFGCGGQSKAVTGGGAGSPNLDGSVATGASGKAVDSGVGGRYAQSGTDASSSMAPHARDGGHDGMAPGSTNGKQPCSSDADCSNLRRRLVGCADQSTEEDDAVCLSGVCGYPKPRCSPLTACQFVQCGDPCQYCYPSSGKCTSGFCNANLGCLSQQMPDCSPDALPSCSPTIAGGLGSCRKVFGWGWDGGKCIAIVGCTCEGPECASLYTDQDTCITVFENCRK